MERNTVNIFGRFLRLKLGKSFAGRFLLGSVFSQSVRETFHSFTECTDRSLVIYDLITHTAHWSSKSRPNITFCYIRCYIEILRIQENLGVTVWLLHCMNNLITFSRARATIHRDFSPNTNSVFQWYWFCLLVVKCEAIILLSLTAPPRRTRPRPRRSCPHISASCCGGASDRSWDGEL